MNTTLSQIAHGRSGDKGNHANIAIIAYNPAGYQWILEKLTADYIFQLFESDAPSRVERFEVPNVLAVNFVLYDVLHGGASQSLYIDTQGKSLAFRLLGLRIGEVDPALTLRNPEDKS